MSTLRKFLRSVRLRKNISELKAARRAELPLEEYVKYEYNPEKTPLNILKKMFEAIEMSSDEQNVFNEICLSMYRKPLLKNNKRNNHKIENICKSKNIIPLQSNAGIKRTSTVEKINTYNKDSSENDNA